MARDLFGRPIDPGHGQRGRPRHMPSPAQRKLVRSMHKAGQSQPAIAKALGITVPTLAANYPSELESTSTAAARRAARDRARGNKSGI